MFNKLNRSCRLFWLIIIVLSVLFLYISNSTATTQVTLEWSQNSEPDLAGYRVFYREEGLSYDYANPAWETIDTTCTIYDLDETKTNHFVARAFDTEGFESADSNEVTLEPTPVVEEDNLLITSLKYNMKKRTLAVKATSDATSAVVLTTWAVYDFGSVELGNLKYFIKKGYYSYTFRKISSRPSSVVIISSGGGQTTVDIQ